MWAVDERPIRFGRDESASVLDTGLDTETEVYAVSDDPKAWVVIEGDSPPPHWANRAVEAWIVRLVPGEVRDVLTERATRPALDPVELRLARLVARGLTTHQIAGELRVDHRTVQRQLARLREKLRVGTKAELTALLAEAGL